MEHKKFNKVKSYKCDVINCENKVYSPGAICPSCLEKLATPTWVFNHCIRCGAIISIHKDEPNIITCLFGDWDSAICKNCKMTNLFDYEF